MVMLGLGWGKRCACQRAGKPERRRMANVRCPQTRNAGPSCTVPCINRCYGWLYGRPACCSAITSTEKHDAVDSANRGRRRSCKRRSLPTGIRALALQAPTQRQPRHSSVTVEAIVRTRTLRHRLDTAARLRCATQFRACGPAAAWNLGKIVTPRISELPVKIELPLPGFALVWDNVLRGSPRGVSVPCSGQHWNSAYRHRGWVWLAQCFGPVWSWCASQCPLRHWRLPCDFQMLRQGLQHGCTHM